MIKYSYQSFSNLTQARMLAPTSDFFFPFVTNHSVGKKTKTIMDIIWTAPKFGQTFKNIQNIKKLYIQKKSKMIY